MGGFIAAWLVGEGIVIYRSVKTNKTPPGPGQLLFSSGVFILLGLLAEAPKARTLAITLAWGFDIAAFMNVAGTKIKAVPDKNWPPRQASTTMVFPDGKTMSSQEAIHKGVQGVLDGQTGIQFGKSGGSAASGLAGRLK